MDKSSYLNITGTSIVTSTIPKAIEGSRTEKVANVGYVLRDRH